MSSISIPRSPHYRINLFYGPERLDGVPPRQSCVFNVKKRSWPNGVQIAIEVTEDQVTFAKERMAFERWLRDALAAVSHDERGVYERRAHDLLVQAVCALKLDLAIQAGLPRENQTLAPAYLAEDLTRSFSEQRERLQTHILAELDLPV